MSRITRIKGAVRGARNTLLIGLLAGATLSACSIPTLRFPGVYKIPIQQGNLITQEMVDQLETGMTRRQVIFVLGTPIVRDPYHQDRWDYVYNYEPGGGVRGQERLSVFFEDDVMTHFTGDFTKSQAAGGDTAPPTQNGS
jgi:outer membrane protein assembly factor BamE